MMAAGGENVYSTEVEAVLSAHPQVQQAAAFGVPNAVMGEMVHAAVVLHPNAAPISSQQLIKWCHASLAAYKCPTSIHLLAELPLTGSGKVLKTALRTALAPGGPMPAIRAPVAADSTAAATEIASADADEHVNNTAALAALVLDKAVSAAGPESTAAIAAPESASTKSDSALGEMESLVVQFAQKECLPVAYAPVLDTCKCYLLVVPDWEAFSGQVCQPVMCPCLMLSPT